MTNKQDVSAPAVAGTDKASETVTVACKIPNGLVLQLCQKQKRPEQGLGVTREVNVFSKVGDTITVAGPAYPNGPVPKGFKRRPEDADGYALTRNVPAAFWEAWLAQNKDTDFVMSGMIFAFPDIESVMAKARDGERIKSGLQPLDPDGDSRVPGSVGPISMIRTEEEWQKAHGRV